MLSKRLRKRTLLIAAAACAVTGAALLLWENWYISQPHVPIGTVTPDNPYGSVCDDFSSPATRIARFLSRVLILIGAGAIAAAFAQRRSALVVGSTILATLALTVAATAECASAFRSPLASLVAIGICDVLGAFVGRLVRRAEG